MDAKVLRAAVSAAIRVTVSTTLMGCGGNVTTDAGGARTPENNDSSSSHEPTSSAKGAGDQSSVPYPTNGTESNGTKAGSATATGGAPVGGANSTGGVEVGGMANAAGAYEENSAGAPTQSCAPAAEACLTTLEQTPPAQPPSDSTKACCETVLQAISPPPQLGDECFDSLNARFMQFTVRPQCCTDPSSWSHQACTPWGPPVPPELSAEALLEWSAAA